MRPHCWVMVALAGIMSYFSPERALGAPQREVSQSRAASLSPPPYVVILISCSGLVSFVLLLLTCLCCKRGGVGFNEFDNADGEECSGGSSPIQEDSLSSCPSLPEVYTLPVRDRPNCPSMQDGADSKSQCFKRHTLNYLQEIGNGWFGKVILAEVLCDCSSSQAVVKELRVSASPLEQRKFLAESEPYRSLKHPNILQCLGQCSENIPFLLVMEFCQLGDLKRYLRAQRKSDGMTPDLPTRDLLTLQRMAFEITSGLLHLHENNYIHSDLDAQEEIDPQVDNFSSVDFPSPPPSIDLDVQDDKLESLDDSFPSPPPSVTEAEEFISHINLDDFIASTETEPYISPTHNTDVSEPPLQESPPATTQSKGISANLNLPSVHITLHDESNLQDEGQDGQDEHSNLSQKTSSTIPSSPQAPLNNLPELLISEWKDLDEEPLEDFEKLEQLCCISGDEEDTLGELFLGNLELLESLKKTPDQKGTSAGDSDTGGEVCGSSTPQGSMVDLKEDRISDNSDKLGESVPPMILDSQDRLSPQEERNDMLRSSGQTSEVKDQGSLSKMTTKNGLMMQVCEERLQFSLSENVKTNVLWGSTVKDSVMLRPWGEQITESSELVAVREQKDDGGQEEQEIVPSIQPHIKSGETKTEPFTVIEQPEVPTPQPTANQAMKAKLARLSLALPPLALTLPLTPTGKGGFGDGAIGNRIGRRRGLSSGSDPDDEEEDEQEDESSRRVIVVTETDVDKRVGLRSLLKSPKEPMDREKDRGRNVSFFDDVTIYLFDQETPTNELSTSTPTSPASVSVKSTKLDLHGPNIKSKESKRKEDLSIKPRSPVGANPVTSSRFTVSPADDPHL
ncbi:uncharacterized protein AKAME5_001531900, partial [Lates japonicus]